VQPRFSAHRATFVYAFPDTQAALAKIGKLERNDKVSDSALKLAEGLPVAHRFEIYWQGLELANGFYELVDADEQLRRFVNDNQIRKQLGYPEIAIDNDFIGALRKGMPECAGVAMGIDRLLMALCKVSDIGEVITEA
jgi:lysyl-tRNA synthetase class 2